LKPGTISETNKIIIAFITKVKSQIVKIFIGSVKKIKMGLMKAFTSQRTKATQNADKNPAIVTQGKIYAVIITAIAVISKLIIIPIKIKVN